MAYALGAECHTSRKPSKESLRRLSNRIDSTHLCIQLAILLNVDESLVTRKQQETKNPNEIALEVLIHWGKTKNASCASLYEAPNVDVFKDLARDFKEELVPAVAPSVNDNEPARQVAAVAAHGVVSSGSQPPQRPALLLHADLVDIQRATFHQAVPGSPGLLPVHAQTLATSVESHHGASFDSIAETAGRLGDHAMTRPLLVDADYLLAMIQRKNELRRMVATLQQQAVVWGRNRLPFGGEQQSFIQPAEETEELEKLREENEMLTRQIQELERKASSVEQREQEREKEHERIVSKLEEQVQNLARQVELLKQTCKEKDCKITQLEVRDAKKTETITNQEGVISQLKDEMKDMKVETASLRADMNTVFSTLKLHGQDRGLPSARTTVFPCREQASSEHIETSAAPCVLEEKGAPAAGSDLAIGPAAVDRPLHSVSPAPDCRNQQGRALVTACADDVEPRRISICNYAKEVEQNVVELITSPAVWPEYQQPENVANVSLTAVMSALTEIKCNCHRAVRLKQDMLTSLHPGVTKDIETAKERGADEQLCLSSDQRLFEKNVMDKVEQLGKNPLTKRLSVALNSCWMLAQWCHSRKGQGQ